MNYIFKGPGLTTRVSLDADVDARPLYFAFLFASFARQTTPIVKDWEYKPVGGPSVDEALKVEGRKR